MVRSVITSHLRMMEIIQLTPEHPSSVMHCTTSMGLIQVLVQLKGFGASLQHVKEVIRKGPGVCLRWIWE